MLNRRFYLNIIIRVLLILATCILFAFSLSMKKPFMLINHTFLIIIQVFLLIRFLNKTNRELARVFDSLRDHDFSEVSLKFPANKSLQKLYESVNDFVMLLKEARIDHITKSEELLAAIENVGTGLIWFSDHGHIELINQAAKKMLGIKSIANVHELDAIHNDFSGILKTIRPSQQRLLKIVVRNEAVQLAIKATIMVQREKRLKLISLHNIKNELDEAEMDSWQKLIRVLAHEIMNSIGPITTSTSDISRYFKENDHPVGPSKIDQLVINNTIKGLQIIEERSMGLKAFVSDYRAVTNLPTPVFEEINVDDLIDNNLFLLKDDLQGIKIEKETLPLGFMVKVDRRLISQAMINLLLNAKHALEGHPDPVIRISAEKLPDDTCAIRMMDNGKGIPADIMDKIFVPFFTTREDGSGIGLSLARQIMRLHGGTLSVQSEEGEGAVFSLLFR